jgi:hypothetical protein
VASAKELQNKVDGLTALLAKTGRDRADVLAAMRASSPGQAAYIAAKKKYDSFDKEYKKVESQLNSAKSELSSVKTTNKATADAKDRESKAKAKEAEAQLAEDTNNPALAAQLRAEAAEIRKPTPKANVDPKTGKTILTDEQAVANLLATARISEAPGGPVMQWSSPNTLNPKGDPVVSQGYIYVEPGTKKDERIPSVIAAPSQDKGIALETSDVARDKYEAQLVKLYGSKQGLINKLYQSGYLTSNKIPASQADKLITGALDRAASDFTIKQLKNYQFYGVKEFETMDEFLTATRGAGTTTKTYTDSVVMGRTEADKNIIAIYKKLMGREPNEKELAELRPLLQKQQGKNPNVISTTRDIEGDLKSRTTKTGLDTEQYLIEQIAEKDEAKANQILGYYDVFKRVIGVN